MPDRTRCFMRFERCLESWRVTVKQDGRTLREITFADESKVEEMARRGGGLYNLECRQGLERGLRSGLGGLDLFLTAEQISKLKR